MVLDKHSEKETLGKAREALKDLGNHRGDRALILPDEAFRRRYGTQELLSLDIRLFVHLITCLRPKKLASVLAAPNVTEGLQVTPAAERDFQQFLVIYKLIKKKEPLFAELFLHECSAQRLRDRIESEGGHISPTSPLMAQALDFAPKHHRFRLPCPDSCQPDQKKRRLADSMEDHPSDLVKDNRTIPAVEIPAVSLSPHPVQLGQSVDATSLQPKSYIDIQEAALFFLSPVESNQLEALSTEEVARFVTPQPFPSTSGQQSWPVNDENVAYHVSGGRNDGGGCDTNHLPN